MFAVKHAHKINTDLVKRNPKFDAIIVPGVPLNNGTWDSVMKARVLWSVHLFTKGIAKNIIYSGGAVYTPYYEATVMGLYAQKLGVPAKNIYYDTIAKHSTENVYYSYLIALENKFSSIALATDPFQSILLRKFTKKRFASYIQHIPISFDTIRNMKIRDVQIDTQAAACKQFIPIAVRESFIYRLKGTLGRHLDFGAERQLPSLKK
ncbi:MAG: YdcF family protein [Bacteroidetes bacterium]|nr:YdcF family protein [Bacteroidota bacterium]